MTINAVSDLLSCPTCTERLHQREQSLECSRGHRFDLARQGYVNLLGTAPPANADTADMVAARLHILAGGHFTPLVDALTAACADAETIVDAGAGPGWYLAQLMAPGRRGLAGDVSVPAARRAAKAHPMVGAAVWNVWRRWPVADGCADVCLCVFAPRNGAEAARVLRSGGRFVVATPGSDHLRELRREHHLLDVPADKEARLATQLGDQFRCVANERVTYRRELSADEATAIVAMGPNAFHRRVAAQAGSVTFDVQVTSWSVRGRSLT